MGASVSQISLKRRARRSKRLGLRVPVLAYGQGTCGQPFHELTHTVEINANGALILLDAFVQERQTILLENLNTQLDEECRVVNVRSLANGRWVVGIEFKQTAAGFWEIYLHRPDERF